MIKLLILMGIMLAAPAIPPYQLGPVSRTGVPLEVPVIVPLPEERFKGSGTKKKRPTSKPPTCTGYHGPWGCDHGK